MNRARRATRATACATLAACLLLLFAPMAVADESPLILLAAAEDSLAPFSMPEGASYVPGEIIVVRQGEGPTRSVMPVAPGGEERAINEYLAQPDVSYAQPNYYYECFSGSGGGSGGGGGIGGDGTVDAHAAGDPPEPEGPPEPEDPPEPGDLPEPDEPAAFVPGDPYYISRQQEYMQLLGMEHAWAVTMGSPEIKIAVIDTGANLSHADMFRGGESQYVDQACTIGGQLKYGDSDATDMDLHGAFVAGVIGAVADNGIGIAGVAPGCKIMPIRAGNGISGSPNNFTSASVALAIDYAIERGARVINMSFGSENIDRVILDACYRAEAAGVAVVSSAGNSDERSGRQSAYWYPASYPTVLSVSGAQADGQSSGLSANDAVDLAAPANHVYSTSAVNANGYFSCDGSSFAAPFVSGICALLLSVEPSLTPRELRYLLRSTAQDMGDPGYDPAFGYGVANAWDALAALDALAASISAGVGVVPGDGIEPNDIPAHATPLAFAPAAGPGNRVAASVQSTLDSPDDVDAFYVEFAEHTSAVELAVDAPPDLAIAKPLIVAVDDAPAYFKIYHDKSPPYDAPVSAGGKSIDNGYLEAGGYYVIIQAFSRGESSHAPYYINMSAPSPYVPTPTPTTAPTYPSTPGQYGPGPIAPGTVPPGSLTPTPLPTPTPSPSPSATPTPRPTRAPRPTAAPSPTPAPAPARPPRAFTDVPATQWASTYIQALSSLGIVDGYPQDDGTYTFMPDGQITRAELAKLIVASLGLPLKPGFDGSRFADWGGVAEWAVPYIGAAVDAGIIYGSSENGQLYVNAAMPVTRQEMVAMASRSITGSDAMASRSIAGEEGAAGDAGGEGNAGAPAPLAAGGVDPADVVDFAAADEWAKDALAFALRHGLVDASRATDGAGAGAGAGTGAGTNAYMVRPLKNATRAETAYALYKMIRFAA